MAANATKDKAAKAKDKEREAKRKDKERAAKAKEKEKAAKAKEKQKAAKAKEREKAAEAKAKEEARAKKAKQKQREDRQKEKEREAKAKQRRDAQRAANAKEKEREAKAKAKQREAREKEKQREAKAAEKARAKRARPTEAPAPEEAPAADEVVQPVEEVAVPERGEAEEVPAGRTADESEQPAEPALPDLDVPDNDRTVRPKGYLAEALGKEDAVERSTQRATLAASYTTRDHDVIRAWAQTRNGRPADVKGTGGRRRGPGTAGVLRIEFPDGPGDDSRLEDIDWGPFFATFDDSDVDFLYQERVRTGDVSRFHKFVRTAS
ncbi:MAG TPA: hypothetical protein VFR07_18440 [Mycobacteriales bacterium]|jgi:hypothetical protein|nr:hypothetical protein [Mycobacteriales bacterium]